MICRAFLLAACWFGFAAAAGAQPSTTTDLGRGQTLFRIHCGGCHGFEGRGGFGPNLAQSKLRNAPTMDALATLILTGIPGTAMPAFRMFLPRERFLLAAYVRSLGEIPAVPLSGDPRRGEVLIATKGACLNCHTISGRGGVTGPDLTEVGLRRGPEYLRRALTEPGAQKIVSAQGYLEFLPVRLVTSDGRELTATRLNEDGFTIQVRDLENRLHSFQKSDLQLLTKAPVPTVMPSYAGVFATTEMDDVVAYLAGLRGSR